MFILRTSNENERTICGTIVDSNELMEFVSNSVQNITCIKTQSDYVKYYDINEYNKQYGLFEYLLLSSNGLSVCHFSVKKIKGYVSDKFQKTPISVYELIEDKTL